MHLEAPQQILLLLIILFPLGGAIINGLLGRYMAKGLVTLVGVGSVAVSFALAVASFVELYGQIRTSGNTGWSVSAGTPRAPPGPYRPFAERALRPW